MRRIFFNKCFLLILVALLCSFAVYISMSLSVRDGRTDKNVLSDVAEVQRILKLASISGAHEIRGTPKILCQVLTQQANLATKAQAVKDTWGHRCDKLLFFSSAENKSFPIIVMKNVSEGREFLTQKTFTAFNYSFREHGDQFDWFLKADDDSYVIMENLKLFLSQLDPQRPIITGYTFKVLAPQGYMSGGAGYVLSKEAVRLFVTKGLMGGVCNPYKDAQVEDLDMGTCMDLLGAEFVESIDSHGRERFHPLGPISYFNKHFMPDWLYNNSKNAVKMGPDCCSKYTISFHYVTPYDMRIMDFLLYHTEVVKLNKDDNS